MSEESTKAEARAEIIREAQRILVDQLTNDLLSHSSSPSSNYFPPASHGLRLNLRTE